MRRALLRPLVVVRENAEAEIGILVQDLALGRVVRKVRSDEILVLQRFLQQRADLAAAGRIVLRLEYVAATRREVLERLGHVFSPLWVADYFTAPAPQIRHPRHGVRSGRSSAR